MENQCLADCKRNAHYMECIQYFICLVIVYDLLIIHPLYYHNFYFDIVTCKYKLFVSLVGICSGIFFAVSIAKWIIIQKYKIIYEKDEKSSISIIDKLIFMLWLVNFISLLFSNNMKEALFGTPGRQAGFITITCYVAIYFIISRYMKLKEYIFIIIGLVGSIVSIIAILQFFFIDILGFYQNLSISQKEAYYSTLGHSNVFTSYYAIIFPMMVLMQLCSCSIHKKVFYCCSTLICFCGMFCARCDSSYIILIVTFILGVWAIHTYKQMIELSFNYLVMILLAKCIVFLNAVTDNHRIIEDLPAIFTKNVVTVILSILLIGFCGICFMLSKYKRIDIKSLKRIIVFIFIGIILFYLISLILFSTVFQSVDLGAATKLLRFSDSFGSYRGYIWRIVITEYQKLPFGYQMIGIGCDTVEPFLTKIYGMELYEVTNAYYDNAHNEYLQYLLTTGFLGLSLYLSICGLQLRKVWNEIKSMIKNSKELNMKKVIVAGIICYLIHAVVGINQIVTTPIFVLLFSMINSSLENSK